MRFPPQGRQGRIQQQGQREHWGGTRSGSIGERIPKRGQWCTWDGTDLGSVGRGQRLVVRIWRRCRDRGRQRVMCRCRGRFRADAVSEAWSPIRGGFWGKSKNPRADGGRGSRGRLQSQTYIPNNWARDCLTVGGGYRKGQTQAKSEW